MVAIDWLTLMLRRGAAVAREIIVGNLTLFSILRNFLGVLRQTQDERSGG
jgi:hypothetical protein